MIPKNLNIALLYGEGFNGVLAHPAVLMDCKPPCRESRAGRMSTPSSALVPSLPLFSLASACFLAARTVLLLAHFTSLGSSSVVLT